MFLTRITEYWDSVADRYSEYVYNELNSENGKFYADVLKNNAPEKEGINCLDLGCGAGFCSVFLAKAGYKVTAVDCSSNMIDKAKDVLNKFNVKAKLVQSDVHKLGFESGSFDYIIARNVVWDLENPKTAYKEWLRLLKKDGKILIADGNYFLHYFDHDYKTLYDKQRKSGKLSLCDVVDVKPIEKVIRNLPLTAEHRPKWDMDALFELGAQDINIFANNINYTRPITGLRRSLIPEFIICASKKGIFN